ncbi:MAG: DUF3079 domain-containing protein [Gammaproteobacteria bacterium]|jgi:hypothetical protein|nr:DUF3079 domain-containing protein [Gammaproteobacteria bacterium]
MAKKFPLRPRHPERICWGCDKYCPADDLACGNGSDRTQHPIELLGEDWAEWRPLDDELRDADSPEGEALPAEQ